MHGAERDWWFVQTVVASMSTTRLRKAFKCAGVPEPLLIHQVAPKILKLHSEELYIYFKGGFHPAGFHRAGFINLIMYSCVWVSLK